MAKIYNSNSKNNGLLDPGLESLGPSGSQPCDFENVKLWLQFSGSEIAEWLTILTVQ